MRRLGTVLSACLLACGDNRPEPVDAGAGPEPFQPAPHAPMPIVFPHSGTVLSAMQLVTITFDGYDADAVESFGDALVASSWYRSIGAEYGMSAARHAQKARVGAAPATLGRSQIAAWIIDRIALGDVLRPGATDNQLLYLIYVPPTVARAADLQGLRGYHEMLTFDGARFPIAVVLDDGGDPATTTTAAAHQLIDAVTNPYQQPHDGYYTDPVKSDPWSLVRGEIADLCEGEERFVDNGVAFPRVYSSAAAQVSLPPCKPAMVGDTWSDVTAEPSQIQSVKPGGTVKFRLTGWSTSPLPDWKIRVQQADSSDLSEDEMHPQLSSDTINNNITVTLTLRAPLEATPGAVGGVYVLSGDNNRPWAVGFTVVEP